ncbi:Fuselloviral protein SSV2p11 [Saccharolobus solfataricus]|uniref:Fuselloviral protein SSV2p11 n=2 Tax=Saccharolobus solfataricus TaxID=2287 RepID=A0A157SYP8_SACSO|nr:Fuselloviral protein SSV2p11 [Saccharolobus solfataricus]
MSMSVVRKYNSFLDWLAETKDGLSFLLRYDKELEVLLIISRFNEGITKHRLEQEANVNGIRLNEILSRLRSNGLIYSLTDGKKQLIFLTEKGKEVVELIAKLSRIR